MRVRYPGRRYEAYPVPNDLWNQVLVRCQHLVEAAMNMRRSHRQDFVDTLSVSCYLQGLQDGVQMVTGKRIEGWYEQER